MEIVTENINSSGKSLLGSDFDSSRLLFSQRLLQPNQKESPSAGLLKHGASALLFRLGKNIL